MKIIIVAVLSIAIMLTLACGNSGSESADVYQQTPVVADHPGKKIYNSYCIVCHGSDGSMGANGAHNLQESVLTLEERIQVITYGRNTMTAFEKVMSAEKIAQVADYVANFRPKSSE